MANYIVTTDEVVGVGNGRTLVADYDTLFVGRNATLGSYAPGGGAWCCRAYRRR